VQPDGHHTGAPEQAHESSRVGAIDHRETPDVVRDHFRGRLLEQLVAVDMYSEI